MTRQNNDVSSARTLYDRYAIEYRKRDERGNISPYPNCAACGVEHSECKNKYCSDNAQYKRSMRHA